MMSFDFSMNKFILIIPLILLFLVAPRFTAAESQNATDVYRGVDYCNQCHPGEVENWSTSKHAQAYSDSGFMSVWKSLNYSAPCLECHTTGFDEATDEYIFEGVTCEQCHGPGTTMRVNASSLFCATCHSGPYPTYQEWTKSGPGHLNATCLLCHQQHTLTVFGGNSTTACGQCHESHVNLVKSSEHGAAGLECKVCHMYLSPANFTSGTPAQTGHSFSMNATQLNCAACHDFTLEKHDTLGVDSAACLTCHGEIHGLRLKLVNGTVVPLNDTVPLCGECHLQRLIWWEEGIHGAQTDQYSPCTDCHKPHDPVINNIETLSYYPPRQEGESPPLQDLTAVAVVVVFLFLLAIIWRR